MINVILSNIRKIISRNRDLKNFITALDNDMQNYASVMVMLFLNIELMILNRRKHVHIWSVN
ncbi:hypothetical protein T03_6999 [Trichinella britovi]|uniref:Uncharacterized protein n=1 Tax=Trichinella britovi TaxID=45882 RepID=A0A0V1CPS8_TRIBR|nr:hypothetical protein T03_6999 [Trichinella britovi]